MKKVFYILIILAILGLLWFLLMNRESESPIIIDDGPMPNDFSIEFRDQIITLAIKRAGQPIEGFNAFMLKRAFPGLVDEDFNDIETFEGHYELVNGVIEYKRDKDQPVTSAEDVVSKKGYSTLLNNLSNRLKIEVKSEESLTIIIQAILEGELMVFECAPEQREVDACAEIYQPVCAKVNVICITSPCDPVYETMSNACQACKNQIVESYTDGECAGK